MGTKGWDPQQEEICLLLVLLEKPYHLNGGVGGGSTDVSRLPAVFLSTEKALPEGGPEERG